ncbi:MAG TPA: GTPase ObgE [Solirubrobacteraceae bacterium]|nr:GTPase ObgE [Solirubrobacteraceae bacterium]
MHDRAKIHIQAGAGGDGCMSFRREAKVPRGGPDGGDGGRGGEVVLVCDASLRDLHQFRHRAKFHAGRGGHGEGSLRHGADGETLIIKVPPGTEARALGDGRNVGGAGEEDDLVGRRWELLADGQRATIARGGSGGHGNKRFATPTRQAPRFAERGLPGEGGWIELRLRLLADVGLVGLPNAGKSSLLSRLTRAAPKIANYPFTTLSPVLGVLEDQDERRQLVIADIPGLIEGASEGAGLGHEFLAHVERTRLLVHVLDLAPELSADEQADAVANHATIERELAAHDERLAGLPRVLALSKSDLLTPARVQEIVAQWQQRLGPDVPVIATSSATGAGISELGKLLLRIVAEVEVAAPAATPSVAAGREAPWDDEELAEHMVFRPAGQRRGYEVHRLDDGVFDVSGRGVERLLSRYDIQNADALAYLEERLRRIGVLDALQREGFVAGDEVRIAGVPFELDPDLAGW